MSKWISVKDKLPEIEKVVIISFEYTDNSIYPNKIMIKRIARRIMNIISIECNNEYLDKFIIIPTGEKIDMINVRYWMEMPEIPEEFEQNQVCVNLNSL